MLSQLKVFETLTNGNGDRLHLLARSWGREENNFEIELKRSTGMSITSRLRQAFEFLTQSILKDIFIQLKQERIDISEQGSSSADQQQSPLLYAKQASFDSATSSSLLDTISNILLDNLSRYIDDKSKTRQQVQDTESIMYMGVNGTTEGDSKLSRFYPADLA